MKSPLLITGALLLTAALAGCTAPASAPAAVEKTASAPPTPTVDPGPVKLTNEEAAERYLNLVCPNNIAIDALEAAFDAGEEEFLKGGAPDPTAVKAAAATRVALNRQSLEILDDDYYIWPDGVSEQLPDIRSSYLTELSVLDGIANAASFEDGYYATWPAATPEQQGAGQEVRYQLGLEADTVATCAGREGGLDKLKAELDERTVALKG